MGAALRGTLLVATLRYLYDNTFLRHGFISQIVRGWADDLYFFDRLYTTDQKKRTQVDSINY